MRSSTFIACLFLTVVDGFAIFRGPNNHLIQVKCILGENSPAKDLSVDSTGPPHRAQEVVAAAVAAASTVPPLAEVYAVDKSFSSTSNVELDHLKLKIKAVEFCIDNFPSTSLPEGGDETFVRYVKRYSKYKDENTLLSILASLESKESVLLQQQQQQAAALQQTVSNELVVRREYLRCYQKWQLGGPEKLPFYDDTKRCVLPFAQDFESYRTKPQSYMVDKSVYIEPLLSSGRPSIFLRPRRFGKSLTLSMLKYFFYGAVNLFEGMAVYDKIIRIEKFVWNPSNASTSSTSTSVSSSSSVSTPVHNFPPCPVLHLDFSGLVIKDARSFEDSLINLLKKAAVKQGATPVDDTMDCGSFLDAVLNELCSQETNQWGKVVVLIDEYDAPLNYNPDIRNDLLEIYKRFFAIIKASGALIEYVYVTGISSYGMTGIFSGANNFENLSFRPEFEGLCGFTTEETKEVMRKADYHLDDGDFAKYKKKYNGYSWCSSKDFGGGEDDNKLPTEETSGTQVKNSIIVPDLTTSEEGSCTVASDAASKVKKGTGVITYFNSYLVASSSIVRSMDESYWVATSSESLYKTFPSLLSASLPTSVSRESLQLPYSPESVSRQDPATSARTLLELGYATITACDVATGLVTLDYPNDEIREYMKNELVAYCFPRFRDWEGLRKPLSDALIALNDNLDIAPLLKLINYDDESMPSQFSPSWYKDEDAWRGYIYRLLKIAGFICAAEINCSLGRSDIEIYIPKLKALIVIEMKIYKEAPKVKKTEVGSKANDKKGKAAKGLKKAKKNEDADEGKGKEAEEGRAEEAAEESRKADSMQLLLQEKYVKIASDALNQIAVKRYGTGAFARDPLKSIEKVVFVAIVASFQERRLAFLAEEYRDADRARGPDGFTRSVEL